ncbi:hypothetical protein PMAYCL1PPCAC_29133 [Pristionchus mayeri]|uniref:Uncharacterized protein n=1 Tax=Pristionchus mayeri TaxID=1317129 RepID=A0AAN5D8P6_9BILA|nr:hypothetical protein PMAYCL1PPCAC_29133 [Pristionchus mayeri]
MGMLLFLLLLIPLFSAETADQANLGFDCDEKKCIFTLSIPQSAVSFIDVDLLESEIAGLNRNVTDLRANEELINNEEQTFIDDFDSVYVEAQSTLTAMFNLSSSLNETSYTLLADAQKKEKTAIDLKDALNCMVQGDKSAAECGKDVPDIQTTLAPGGNTDETTDGPTKEPFTGTTTTEKPFTGTTTTEEPFTGTTTTEEPFTGSTTTAEPFTGTTVAEPEKSTTTGPTQSSTEPGTEPTDGPKETKSTTTALDDGTSATPNDASTSVEITSITPETST